MRAAVRRAVVVAAALVACGGGRAPVAQAQKSGTALAAGLVRRLAGNDSVPVGGTRVLLHEVALAKQGPVDSAVTDALGRFQFRFRADSGALYLVSARHDGIEYFSPPLAVAPGLSDTEAAIIVADTSSAAPVRVDRRRIALARPSSDGSRDVLDLTTLRNDGPRTRVAPDTTRPSWSAPLPVGADSLIVGQGDFSPEAVTRHADSVLVFAPISPGEKQLTLNYRLPVRRRAVDLHFADSVATVDLLVEEPEARVSGFAGAAVDTQTLQDRSFRRWHGSVRAGATIRVEFGRGREDERWILITLVGGMAAALLIFAWRYRVLAAAALVALVVSACDRSSPARGAVLRVVDDAGDTTVLAAPARRVVSLVPATTELLFAIGAGGAVVGRTKWCDYPPASAAVASVGDGVNPNVETVLARHPDLVVFYRSAQHTATVDHLRSLGIAAVQLNTDVLSDVPRVARLLGQLTGHERGADSLARAFDTALAGATVAPGPRRPSVLLLVWEQPPMTVGTGSFLSELVARAGGDNLFGDVSASSATVSIEAIAARDPDLVLVASDGPTAFASRPEWQAVRAVRERRFIPVKGSAFGHPGPRSPAAIAQLAERLRTAVR